MHQAVNSFKLATNVGILGAVVEVLDGWMVLIAAKDFLGLGCPASCQEQSSSGSLVNALVGLVDVVDGEDG